MPGCILDGILAQVSGGYMSERVFRIILGSILLAALYFDLRLVIYGFIIVILFEGITNWRVPLLVSRLPGAPGGVNSVCTLSPGDRARVNFEAERALRLAVAAFLIISYLVFSKELWFFPGSSGLPFSAPA
jgi:hypothetical protein